MGYKIRFNNLSNEDLNFSIVKRPSIPVAKKQVNKINIKGIDGDYYEDLETYDDIEFEISCNFISTADNWNKDFRKIRRWINNKEDNSLELSDNKGYFYRVKNVIIDSNERIIKRIGKFAIKFIVDPYEYITDGVEETELTTIIQNDYSVSKPIYRIEGNGECTLNVNGNSIKCNVNNNGLIINTDLGLIYYNDGTYANTKVQIEDFKSIYLKEESNTFSWSSGFNIYIIPNFKVI